jgi:hybrid cluster-associated redox disulfide protein
MMSRTVNATDTIAEILAERPDAARILIHRGMHCVGCAMTRFETLAEACAIYGISTDELLADLNRRKGSRRGGSKRPR